MLILYTNIKPRHMDELCHTLMYADYSAVLSSENFIDQLTVKS